MFRSIGKMPEINSFRQLSSYDWGFCSLRIFPLHDLDLQTGAVLSGNWFVPLPKRCCLIDVSKVILGPRIWAGHSHRNYVYSSARNRISLFPETTRASHRARYIRRCLVSDVSRYNSKDDVGFCNRRGDPPHHVKRMVPRHSRISRRRQS